MEEIMPSIGEGGKEPTLLELMSDLHDAINTGDGSPDSQDQINWAIVLVLRTITKKMTTTG
jgi:hypothetical protein